MLLDLTELVSSVGCRSPPPIGRASSDKQHPRLIYPESLATRTDARQRAPVPHTRRLIMAKNLVVLHLATSWQIGQCSGLARSPSQTTLTPCGRSLPMLRRHGSVGGVCCYVSVRADRGPLGAGHSQSRRMARYAAPVWWPFPDMKESSFGALRHAWPFPGLPDHSQPLNPCASQPGRDVEMFLSCGRFTGWRA